MKTRIRRTNFASEFKVPLFNGKNFSNWKFQMEILLKEQELLNFITEQPTTEKDKKRQLKCKSLIIQRIDDSHLEYVKNKKSAKEIWDTLKETFEQKSVAGRLHLIRKLLTMKYDEKDSLESHFLLFENRVGELQGSGQEMDKSFFITYKYYALVNLTNLTIHLTLYRCIKSASSNKMFVRYAGKLQL